MTYKCNICKYESNDKSNYNRHMKSPTHLLKFSDNEKLGQMVINDNKTKKNHSCVCGKKFTYLSGLSRHKKTCDDKTRKIEKLEGQVSVLINKVEEVKNMNGLLMELIKSNKAVNNTYNVSVKNYVQQNYPNAPALKEPTDYAKLTYDDDELVDTLIYKYKHKCLFKYLGDFLVEYYKKDDPTQQSVWSSDISRLTYIVKESLADKKSIWNHDYKGVKTKKCIIDPLLQHVKEYIDEYWAKNVNIKINKKKDVDVDALTLRQKKFNITYAIETDIDNGNLAGEIIKYIASYLHMDKNIMVSGLPYYTLNNKFIEYFIDKDEEEEE